jgi:very-short-patch-repair endonuclease
VEQLSWEDGSLVARVRFNEALKCLSVSWAPIAVSQRAQRFTVPMLYSRPSRPRLDSPLEEALYDAMPARMQRTVATQHKIGRYRLDFAFIDEKLCIEVDGRSYHSKDEAFVRDRERDRWLTSQGWRVMRFASDEVFQHAARCVAEIEALRDA